MFDRNIRNSNNSKSYITYIYMCFTIHLFISFYCTRDFHMNAYYYDIFSCLYDKLVGRIYGLFFLISEKKNAYIGWTLSIRSILFIVSTLFNEFIIFFFPSNSLYFNNSLLRYKIIISVSRGWWWGWGLDPFQTLFL